jgi:hypothetical protein
MSIRNWLGFVLSIIAGVTVSGCTVNEAVTCGAEDKQGGVCRGIPATGACNEDASTENISCSTTIDVADDDALSAAVNGASVGTCILLDEGSYGSVTLPAGVSLIGRCASAVQVDTVSMAGGQGAVLRGIEIGKGGLVIDGAAGVRLESVRVNGSTGNGISVKSGSSVTISDSTITSSGRYGIVGKDGVSLMIERSLVTGNEGSGIIMHCSAECAACMARPNLAITDSIIQDNHVGGIDVFTTDMTMNNVDIRGTLPGASFLPFEGGGNLSVAACSILLEARNVRLENAHSYGALVDASLASFGHVDDPEGSVAIRGNNIGLWVQNGADGSISEMNGGRFENNHGVSLGIKGQTQAWIFRRSKIMNTSEVVIPTAAGGSEPMGHGIVWRDKASVKIEDVWICASARVPLLIDGPINTMGSLASEVTNLTLTDGDEITGIWQQNLPMGGMQPMVTNGPAIQTDAGEKFAVPMSPVLLGVMQ